MLDMVNLIVKCYRRERGPEFLPAGAAANLIAVRRDAIYSHEYNEFARKRVG
jgi:hypothetical protein